MLERGEVLVRFPPPTLDAAFFASLMRGMMAALILAAGVWIANGWLTRRLRLSNLKASPDGRNEDS
jgi:hypothetical protein